VSDFPYTPNPASLRRFLEKIPTTGVPDKLTQKVLESLGFKSKNDRYILSVLKALKFVDDSGSPTQAWQRYRNKGVGSSVLASAVKTLYANLFTTYPDANQKDNEALRNYFGSHSKSGEAVLNLTVRTFKTLCELSDFDTESLDELDVPASEENGKAKASSRPVKIAHQSGLTVNINIALQLQATDDATVYDKFFAAMKKHLIASE